VIIWLDADSLPRKVRDIVARAACRTGIRAVFVANRAVPFDEPPHCGELEMRVCSGGVTADEEIAAQILPGDLAITRDIPLAARLLELEAVVINDRGDRFDRDSIAERLSQREWNLQLKKAGLAGARSRSFGSDELKRFADRFDLELRRLLI
jgi:uncharacterized protein